MTTIPPSRDGDSSVLVIFTNFPDLETARRITRVLVVEDRLAACVSLQAPQESTYWWNGTLEEQKHEIPAIMKTTMASWPILRDRLAELHPYQVPEILALPVTDGLPSYLSWAAEETIASTDSGRTTGSQSQM